MKSLLKKAIIFVTLLPVHSIMNAQTTDSIVRLKDFELLPQKYIWLQTVNPVAFSDVDEEGMNAELSYNYQTGNYKNISDPQSQNDGKMFVKGFKRIQNLHLYGGFSYGIDYLKGQKWKDVLLLSPRNPFVLADSIGGNYENESFGINAAASSALNERFKWGVELNYRGGTSSNNNDPRPSINAIRFDIHPGAHYKINTNWGVGFDAEYERYKENISMSVLETNIPHNFFYFQGLGNYYLSTGSSSTRTYRGDVYTVNIQIDRKSCSIDNILQLGYKNNFEKSINGDLSSSASIFKSGDYFESTLSLTDVLMIKRPNIRHIVKFDLEYIPNKGRWYDQQQVTNTDTQIVWVVYNQSIKYKSTSILSSLEYTWSKEKNEYPDYFLTGGVSFEQEDSKFLPDYFFQKYSNISVYLSGNKTFRLSMLFDLCLNTKLVYRNNLSADSDFNGIALADLWTSPVYEYLTSNNCQGFLDLKLCRKTSIGKVSGIMYFSAKANYQKSTIVSDNFNKPDRLSLLTTFGFTF